MYVLVLKAISDNDMGWQFTGALADGGSGIG